MGAFEVMGAFDKRHREEYGSNPASLMTGRAGDLATSLIPLSRVKPILKCRYLVKGWLDQGAFSVVYSESNVGKTFLAMDLALHVAAGMDWHEHRVPTGEKWLGPVVYVASEGGTGIHNRIEAMRRDNPALMSRVDDLGGFLLLKTGLDLCTSDDSQYLVEAIGTMPRAPSLIVVDTLARAMGNGDENTAKDMGQFVRSIDHLREATGAHVMVIHHSGKDATKGARGSGSLRAAADTEIELTRNDSIIIAETRKQRDMPCDNVFAYSLKSVFLGFDDDGDKVSSAVVQQAEIVKSKAKVKLTGTDKIALQALDDCIRDHGEKLTSDNYPRNRRCVSLERWREYCDRHSLSSGESDSAKRKAFFTVKNRLQEKEMVRVIDGWLWRIAPDDEALPPLPTVTSNAGNAGHAAVTTVTAPYKGGNAVTLTQPENRSLSQEKKERTAESLRERDPDAFDPEMWR
ncbi:helicase RepA family protein [Paracoccus angustae]|uniref:Helicase RepA family protein n=1 Tax=Paracoccus angustae TaxID=1671480 RepID=A0ABV7U4L2_9RHOB